MPEQEKIPFIDGNCVNVLTNKDHKNRRMLVVNSGKLWDPAIVSDESLFRMFYLSKCTSCIQNVISLFTLIYFLLSKFTSWHSKKSQRRSAVVLSFMILRA